MITYTPFQERMSSGLCLEYKGQEILLRKERIQSLTESLRQQLLVAISKGLSKKPFEITNLIFDSRGTRTQTMEWRIHDNGEPVLFFFDRGVTSHGDWSMILCPVTDETFPTLREILLWINDCLNQ